jgi:hypothetical protein
MAETPDPIATYLQEVHKRIALVNSPSVEPVPVPGDDAGNARLRLWLEDGQVMHWILREKERGEGSGDG